MAPCFNRKSITFIFPFFEAMYRGVCYKKPFLFNKCLGSDFEKKCTLGSSLINFYRLNISSGPPFATLSKKLLCHLTSSITSVFIPPLSCTNSLACGEHSISSTISLGSSTFYISYFCIKLMPLITFYTLSQFHFPRDITWFSFCFWSKFYSRGQFYSSSFFSKSILISECCNILSFSSIIWSSGEVIDLSLYSG